MALYDNKYWLLSHIRNSFISTDDTGMCELIMSGEKNVRKLLKEKFNLYPDDEDSEDDDELSNGSDDLQLDTNFPSRYRSNTAARLEMLDQVRKKTSRIKHVKWENNKNELSQEDLNDLFVRKDIKCEPIVKKSLFTKIFHQYKEMPSNPFLEYAKFDGCGHVNIPTKKYRIFLTMLPEDQRNYPLNICCCSNAKIIDLIGLILLKCSTKYENFSWKLVHDYSLYITEEDGEVDRDFPCLDHRENIAKFGFTCLGLVEHSDPSKNVSFSNSESVTIVQGFDDNCDKRSKDSSKSDQEKQISSDLRLMDIHKKSMEAPLYKSYNVFMISKMRGKIEIHLGISGDEIEIDPVKKNTKFGLVKQKAINHDIDSIASCVTIEEKPNKAIFRIMCNQTNQDSTSKFSPILQSPPSFKSYDFEADPRITEEIVHKINLILDLRSSQTRKEYVTTKERKYYIQKALT